MLSELPARKGVGELFFCAFYYTKLSDVNIQISQFTYYNNIISDKLLLNFWREISALIYNFTCEITKLPSHTPLRAIVKLTATN